jgi:hypothetical protein
MQKGVGTCLYYGFSLDENELIDLFLDDEFFKYLSSIKENECIEVNNFNKNISHDEISEIRQHICDYFTNTYFDNKYFNINTGIHLECLPCCGYDIDPIWILGIRLWYLPARNRIMIVSDGKHLEDNDIINLLELNIKLGLKKAPNYYAIGTDCWLCT